MTVCPFGLSPEQTRVLGALAEKSATAPRTYPLSSNAVRAACNQRSNRDPVVSYDEETVKAAILALRDRELAKTVRRRGSRILKHAHTLDRLGLTEPEIAILSVLMLRGPQTIDQIKRRTERQHAFARLQDVDTTLRTIAELPKPLLGQLAYQPGQEETRWHHLLQTDSKLGEGATPETPAVAIASVARAHEGLRDEASARADAIKKISRRLDAFKRKLEELKRTTNPD